MTKKEQILECLRGLHEGNEELYFSGDCWQNKLLKYICKALILLLEAELKKL